MSRPDLGSTQNEQWSGSTLTQRNTDGIIINIIIIIIIGGAVLSL
jgi:hypothetical protein